MDYNSKLLHVRFIVLDTDARQTTTKARNFHQKKTLLEAFDLAEVSTENYMSDVITETLLVIQWNPDLSNHRMETKIRSRNRGVRVIGGS